ncbi:Chanoclavine-I aldehyde reductase fgaOx3 [Aspergillus wentii]|nr:Chanoclavine-I aldehyde reductase fgaOx3 [Aspergillus wentii]
MTKLFNPLNIGRVRLDHRIALAPLTRFRNQDDHTPTLPLMKEYYQQRASVPGTLLITESTLVSPRAGGSHNVPGIWNEAQIAGWKEVTDAVHEKGSYIYMQLWGLGRVADPDVLKSEGLDFISSSPIPEKADGVVPREMTEVEIRAFIDEYIQAAKNAIAAGFDGVEIHAANGYLIDQFIQDNSNQRTDAWGGSVENRARFALEIISGVVDAVGADRTAVRFSPWSTFQAMRMEDPIPQFSYLARKVAEFKLAYVHLVEARIAGYADVESGESLDFFLAEYSRASPVIVAGGYTADTAREAVDVKYKDEEVVVAMGRMFISNPDLVFRVKNGVPLRPYEREVFYLVKDPRGYIDYAFSEEFTQFREL